MPLNAEALTKSGKGNFTLYRTLDEIYTPSKHIIEEGKTESCYLILYTHKSPFAIDDTKMPKARLTVFRNEVNENDSYHCGFDRNSTGKGSCGERHKTIPT